MRTVCGVAGRRPFAKASRTKPMNNMTPPPKTNTDQTDSSAESRAEPGGDPAQIRKRSVVISGHRTSISLENAFWDALVGMARQRGVSVNQLVTSIDRNRSGNLSSAIRTTVLLESVRDGSNG
jgi:predicted DNA-binding ribbon-helix-helix protein